jgi:hypothetical protein
MLAGLRRRLSYANVTATLALFVALSTGGAYAANTVFSTDIVDNEVYSADVRNANLAGGGLGAIDLADNSVGTSEATGLTGADIQESTLVGVKDGDSCPSGTALFGRLCVKSDGVNRPFYQALDFCASLGLRLPSWSDANTLAMNHNIPNVSEFTPFWTDDTVEFNGIEPSDLRVMIVTDPGGRTIGAGHESFETVCVTEPD